MTVNASPKSDIPTPTITMVERMGLRFNGASFGFVRTSYEENQVK